jgi:hypothetical protein
LSLTFTKAKILIGTPLRKKPLGRPKYRWENVTINKEIKYVVQVCFSGGDFEHNKENISGKYLTI